MRLSSFRIKNYKSIKNTGDIEVSGINNVFVLAGQNESGKSAVLQALSNFEQSHNKFYEDSKPFSVRDSLLQSITCQYTIQDEDTFIRDVLDEILGNDHLAIEISDEEKDLLVSKLQTSLKRITLTMQEEEGGIIKFLCDNPSLQKVTHLCESLENETPTEEVIPPVSDQEPSIPTPSWEINNENLAQVFWNYCPKIIFFDDFCSLLPNKILLSDLINKNTEAEGYKAVRNVEEILDFEFSSLQNLDDAARDALQQDHNKNLSITFEKSWHQKIYGNNKVQLKYLFEKRDGEGEQGSYIKFFVITKEGQNLSPKQRSKGLIWFLSLWLELTAKKSVSNDTILLLDEPDQHLHIKAQEDMLQLINKLAEGKMQVFYSTHSPHLIDINNLGAIRLVANTEQDGTKLGELSKSATSDPKLIVDAMQPISEAIGIRADTLINQTFNKCIILEGLSDFYYFQGMRLLLSKKDIYTFLPSTSVKKIPSLISFCLGYGKQWKVITDDGPSGQKVFNEIKENLFDADEVEAKKFFKILENVYGIENLFTYSDLKLIETNLPKDKTDKVKVVGEKRKIYFSNRFFEKVKNKEIKKEDLDPNTITKFEEIFDFINKK